MTGQNFSIETALAELSKEFLGADQVGNILNDPIEFPTKLVGEVSLATALRYWNRQMTFEEAYRVINNLNTYWTFFKGVGTKEGFMAIAWECYLAFDAGEFYRSGDDRNIDPSEKYTRPLVENLLRKHKLIL